MGNPSWPGQQPPGGYGPPPGTPWNPGGPPAGPPPGMPGGPYGPPPVPPRKRGPGLVIGLIAAGVVVLAVAVIGIVALTKNDDDGGGGGGGAAVELRTGEIAGGAQAVPGSDGSLAMARPGVERPLVEIFEDFACDHCGTFDKMHDPMLKELAVAGRAKVVFRPMVVFGTSQRPAYDNSVRAAAAQRCLGDGARWLAYQDALYAHQPATLDTPGFRVEDLVSYAAPLGITGADFRTCVTSQRYARSVLDVSRGYVASGLQGTPSVRLDGTWLTSDRTSSADALRAAIESAG
ncbi:DsbA family protein [Actinomadura parmotrematis]|uniref:DsbA family protein n=1 Tax=Actinomadura parmotrematis TaxID=2864039 RepID=A0ABS7FKE4_9ACTN|nr:thioredoxin domain-containing protein [Actinomadura parmotrematis]MBW8480821.1 DsbA family protein [Actinomadura parmotrematis]